MKKIEPCRGSSKGQRTYYLNTKQMIEKDDAKISYHSDEDQKSYGKNAEETESKTHDGVIINF